MSNTSHRGILYVVATPIGNLEDITYRAVRVLGEVDLILCEDTRTSKKLLDRYGITTKTASYNAHATDKKQAYVFDLLREGKSIALVSDAGTPGISDPGSKLVANVIDELGDDVAVISVPGPSAITAAFSISGLFGNEWTFLGFAPHKKGRETFFSLLKMYDHPVAFYESNHRILKTLESLGELYSKNYTVILGRELTKHFEEVLRGTPEELKNLLVLKKEKQKGEFVVILAKNK